MTIGWSCTDTTPPPPGRAVGSSHGSSTRNPPSDQPAGPIANPSPAPNGPQLSAAAATAASNASTEAAECSAGAGYGAGCGAGATAGSNGPKPPLDLISHLDPVSSLDSISQSEDPREDLSVSNSSRGKESDALPQVITWTCCHMDVLPHGRVVTLSGVTVNGVESCGSEWC